MDASYSSFFLLLFSPPLLSDILRLAHTQTYSYSDLLILRPTHTQTYSHSDILIHRLTHTQTYSHPYVLIHRLTHTQTYSYTVLLILRLTHTQTYTYTDFLIHRPTHTQTYSYTDLLLLRPTHTQTYSTHIRFGGCLKRGAGFSTPKGGRQGCLHGLVRGHFVGMSQAVCLFLCPTSFAFGADCEDVSSEALISAPLRGAARGGCTGSFAATLWGCLRRLACFWAQHPSLGEQIARMSQAGCWFQHP